MPGTWVKIRANCTNSVPVAIARCSEWADKGSSACATWADEGSNACSTWADEGSNQCSSWEKDCHWYSFWNCIVEWLCKGWYWVAKWVCKAFYWIAKWVCKAFYWIAKWVCVLWNIILFWICVNKSNGGPMFLLTDGTILMNENNAGYGTRRWWKLAPDNSGSYINGSWSRVADSINGRQFFSSAVLADGRLLVCGGEYSDGSGVNAQDESNLCEIYNPVADTWTSITPPAGWTQIGDGACSLLPDGRFFLGNLNDTRTVIFDPGAGTWTAAGGKSDRSSEETWVLMPDATILTPQCANHPGSEKYVIANNAWQNEGSLPVDLVEASSIETGPAILLPDGRAFFVGATGATALYTPPTISTGLGTWAAGPNIPSSIKNNMGSKDGPGCLMVNGSVLFPAAPVDGVVGNYNQPSTFFEFDGTNIIGSTNVPNNDCPPYMGRMLLLPTGEIMWVREDSADYYAFQYRGGPDNRWRPVITVCPASIAAGSAIQVSGEQFNGLSQAVGYGDDYTAATNYPLVRIRNTATGHVRYCRTSNHTTTVAGVTVPSMGVATGAAIITTNVQIPADIEPGASELFVVANGIPSVQFNITIIGRGRG